MHITPQTTCLWCMTWSTNTLELVKQLVKMFYGLYAMVWLQYLVQHIWGRPVRRVYVVYSTSTVGCFSDMLRSIELSIICTGNGRTVPPRVLSEFCDYNTACLVGYTSTYCNHEDARTLVISPLYNMESWYVWGAFSWASVHIWQSGITLVE